MQLCNPSNFWGSLDFSFVITTWLCIILCTLLMAMWSKRRSNMKFSAVALRLWV